MDQALHEEYLGRLRFREITKARCYISEDQNRDWTAIDGVANILGELVSLNAALIVMLVSFYH